MAKDDSKFDKAQSLGKPPGSALYFDIAEGCWIYPDTESDSEASEYPAKSTGTTDKERFEARMEASANDKNSDISEDDEINVACSESAENTFQET